MSAKRFAAQVHKQTSRLLREKYIKREPAWYKAVLEHPPLPLPAKEPPSRSEFDLPLAQPLTRPASSKEIRPLPVQYVEDEIRKQFFRDHPFEAFRETSLVEAATIEPEHPIRAEKWTRLRQRTRNPSPEDAIRYAVNLHEYHNLSVTHAYASAVAQFHSLRSEHQLAKNFALMESEHYGMQFGPTQVEIAFEKEEKAFETWRKKDKERDMAEVARKRWKAVVERDNSQNQYTKGQEYVRLWKEGIRPTYTTVLAEPEINPEGLTQQIAESPDFMNVTVPQGI
ncbi:37S ribosomal protein S25, mitochondrial [Grifola frondosa]|uniref:Small ribosomal subunit protein mS23 n=1 Tax=Grifola frondosa TaxID=5627 RepID=A0A1C7MRF7_GRIFR|nr:37S ribosomal protein S25, mitochondrial [Grifola frondosa]